MTGFRVTSREEYGVKRDMLFARFALPVIIGVSLVASPVAAQLSSPSYKFLDAVRKQNGADVEKALGETGPTVVNTRDVSNGETALHIVTARRDLTWLNFLLFKGANPNVRNDRGVTPLSLAVGLGWIEGAQALLGQGAQINDPGDGGETPLIGAVHLRNLALIRVLLAAGADPTRADNSGRSARDYAELLGKDSVIATEIAAAAKAAAARKKQTYGPSF